MLFAEVGAVHGDADEPDLEGGGWVFGAFRGVEFFDFAGEEAIGGVLALRFGGFPPVFGFGDVEEVGFEAFFELGGAVAEHFGERHGLVFFVSDVEDFRFAVDAAVHGEGGERVLVADADEDEGDDDAEDDNGARVTDSEWFIWTGIIHRLSKEMGRSMESITSQPYVKTLFWMNYFKLVDEQNRILN